MRATPSGTHSSTIAKQAGVGERDASSVSAFAASSSLPCTLNPPSAWIDCGVRPMWPITGNLGVEDRLHRVDPLAAAFELHRARARADEARRVAHGLLGRLTW